MAVVSFVDTRDVLNRLARVHVTGSTASGLLPSLDPTIVREISDSDLATLVGGSLTPPGGLPAGSYGAGPYGFGPYGGSGSLTALFPSGSLFPGSSVYPHA